MDDENTLDNDKIVIKGKKRYITRTLFQNQISSGEQYLGVFNNICHVQVMARVDNRNLYFGQCEDPQLAAFMYDIIKIQSEGMSAKVNFEYNRLQLLAILFEQSLVQIRDEFQQKKNAKPPMRRGRKVPEKKEKEAEEECKRDSSPCSERFEEEYIPERSSLSSLA